MVDVSADSQELLSVLDSPLFLTDPPIDGGPIALTTLIAHLLTEDAPVYGFPHLAAEQRGYWYRFLVRCGGKAIHELGISVDEASSLDRRDLTAQVEDVLADAAGGRAAWYLWKTDPSEPAFLQPPTPDGEPPSASYREETLSFLTTALGSKNHERKVDTARTIPPEEAAFALVEFQSGVIYGGRYNYQSQLMGSSSGAGSGTPFMGALIGSDLRPTFRHDVEVLLDEWEAIRQDRGLRGDVWALWTEYWDGATLLPASDLDPAFIPLARLLRLDPPEDDVFKTVWFKPSHSERVQDHTDGGNLGDIFTPRVPHPRKADQWKVRGTLEKGYDYKEVTRLLGFGDDARPSPSVRALQASRYSDRSDLRVLFEGTAFERGKTVGFHHREVLLPAGFVERRPWDNPDPAREAHRQMFSTVSSAKSALRGAARFLLAGSPRPRQGDQGKVEPPARLFEQRVDQIYLERLFEAAGREAEGDDSYRTNWGQEVADMAMEAFHDTREEIPSATARGYEREVRAESWLRGRLRELRSPDEESRMAGAASSEDPIEEEPA